MVPVYPFLAAFWLVVGLGLAHLTYHEIPTGFGALDENRGSLTVLAFIFSAYNAVRAGLSRYRERARREALEPPPRPRVDPDRPTDPTFDFSDRPPSDRP